MDIISLLLLHANTTQLIDLQPLMNIYHIPT